MNAIVPVCCCSSPARVASGSPLSAPSATGLDSLAICLLDLAPAAQAERLTARGDDPALVPHHQAFARWMRRQATDPLHMAHVVADDGWEQMRWERLPASAWVWRMQTIDTTGMSRQDVGDAVLGWCRRALAGDAPVLGVTPI